MNDEIKKISDEMREFAIHRDGYNDPTIRHIENWADQLDGLVQKAEPRVWAYCYYNNNTDRWVFTRSKTRKDSQGLYLHPTAFMVKP